MTDPRDLDTGELIRRLQEELARIRASEDQVVHALETVRDARARVQGLVRDLDRARLAEGAEGPSGPAALPWATPKPGKGVDGVDAREREDGDPRGRDAEDAREPGAREWDAEERDAGDVREGDARDRDVEEWHAEERDAGDVAGIGDDVVVVVGAAPSSPASSGEPAAGAPRSGAHGEDPADGPPPSTDDDASPAASGDEGRRGEAPADLDRSVLDPGPGKRPIHERPGSAALLGLVAGAAVMLMAWLAYRGVGAGLEPERLLLAGDPAPAEVAEDAAEDAAEDVEGGDGAADAAEPGAGGEAGGGEGSEPADPARALLASLPAALEARTALYDSLFAARSPILEPLVDSLAEDSSDSDVEDALEAWRDGGDMDAKERDLIHSAFVQLVLRREVDRAIRLDGELLRNPCRGRSCSALLNAWELAGEDLGLPEAPESAPTDSGLLHRVEAALVLERLREMHLGDD